MLDRGTWLAQSVEQATLDLRVMTLSPMLSIKITKKKRERDAEQFTL